MALPLTYKPRGRLGQWLDVRLPIGRVIHDQFVVYPTPRNLNYWWTFGGILTRTFRRDNFCNEPGHNSQQQFRLDVRYGQKPCRTTGV